MGGGHSVSDVTKNVIDSMTNVVYNGMQSAESSNRQEQIIDINCTEFHIAVIKAQGECQKYWAGLGYTPVEVKEVCKVFSPIYFPCGAKFIEMNQVLNTKLNSTQKIKLTASVKNKIENDLITKISQSNGAFKFGNKLTSETSNLIKQTVNAFSNIEQSVYDNIDQTQAIVGGGTEIEFVTMNQATDSIRDVIQKNEALLTAIADLSNKMSKELTQKSSLIIGIGVGVPIAIIVIILFVYLMRWIFKRKRSKILIL
jgi:hypothetical protein